MGEKHTRAQIIASSKSLFARSAQLKTLSREIIAQGLNAAGPPVQVLTANYIYARLLPSNAPDFRPAGWQQKFEKIHLDVMSELGDLEQRLRFLQAETRKVRNKITRLNSNLSTTPESRDLDDGRGPVV